MDTIHRPAPSNAGFSLIETMVAMFILTVGLLGLAQVFVMGLGHMSTSSADLIAREKAREAVESVHTARDTRVITWAQINNTNGGGVFLAGAQPLLQPGPDGLVNTIDDGTACTPAGLPSPCFEATTAPGPDNVLGTDDDVRNELRDFTREIRIREIVPPNATLRELTVVLTYRVGPRVQTYRLITYVSAFS